MFTTERLTLRGFEDDDANHLLALHNDASIQRFITDKPNVPHPSSHKSNLKSWAEKSTLWFTITLRSEMSGKTIVKNGSSSETTIYGPGTFVGFCCVSMHEPKNRDGMFALALVKQFWKMGFGEEASKFAIGHAFSALGLQRISLVVYEGNDAAIKLYQKLGFKEEGRKRRCNWVEGHWEDMIYMGILDNEWDASETARMQTTFVEALASETEVRIY